MLCLLVAVLGLTFFALNAAAVPLASPEAIASFINNLPADQAAGLASLMARQTTDASTNSSMSAIIDSYIESLLQAGFVPNANATTSKRDTLSLEPLIAKRSVPSVPLVIALLGQHGFMPANGTDNSTDVATSKRDISDQEMALQKRTTLPDISLVISRLAAHGFVPTTGSNSSSSLTKRDETSDINSVISQLETYGFNPNDYMQAITSSSALLSSSANSTSDDDDLSATTGVTCPQDDQETFVTGTDTYEILCSAGYNGFDLTNTHSDTLPECLAACSAYVPEGDLLGYGPCAGASWLASFADANCFFKYNATTAGADDRVVSGRKIS